MLVGRYRLYRFPACAVGSCHAEERQRRLLFVQRGRRHLAIGHKRGIAVTGREFLVSDPEQTSVLFPHGNHGLRRGLGGMRSLDRSSLHDRSGRGRWRMLRSMRGGALVARPGGGRRA